MSALQDEIMRQIQQQQQMENYRKSQQSLNSQPTGLVGKVSNLGNSLNNFGSKLSQSQFQPIANLGVKAQGLGNTIGNFANASKGLNAVSNGLSNAAPAVGAATGALEVGGNLANGDYANAGLNALKTGATLAGGPIGMGVAAAIQAAQMLKGEKDKANAEAMRKVNEEANKSMTANAQETSQAQQNFINDSEQAAQNMTQPIGNQALSQDIMSQINPNYTSSASGSPTGFASGINTPDETQTLQNDQSVVPQAEQSVPQQPVNNPTDTKTSLMDKIRSGLTDLKAGYDDNANTSFMQGDLYNRVANKQQTPATPSNYELLANDMKDNFTDEQIQAAKQGLNGGNADIAALVDKYSINKPTTEEEIALAREGNFNPEETTGAAVPLQGSVTKKSIMNRIGEALGTGRRLLSNPYVQAGIAGIATKATGGSTGDALINAYNYGKEKQMADYYYRQLNPGSSVTPILNNFGASDYKNQADIDNANARLQEQIYDNSVKRQLNQEKFEFDKDYKNKKYALDERKFNEQAAYHRGQLGLGQQRLAIAMRNTNSSGQKQRLLNDYKKQVQNDVAAYLSAPPEAKQELKAQLVKEHGVDILQYLKDSGKGGNTNTSTNTNTNTSEPSIYSGIMNMFSKAIPNWAYADYEEEEED